jgi:hypothetical protein
MNRHRLLLLVLLATVMLAWVTLDAGQFLGIAALQQRYVGCAPWRTPIRWRRRCCIPWPTSASRPPAFPAER